MGGNMRHASKGPDKSQSTCEDCGRTWTHGKYSSYRFCESCRENRRDPSGIETVLDLDVDMDEQQIVATVSIENNLEVPVKVDIPGQDDTDEHVAIVGYVRLESGDAYAEDVWIKTSLYNEIKLPSQMSFIWDESSIEQQKKPTQKFTGVVGEEFREMSQAHHGDPFGGDEVEAVFIPAPAGPWIDGATASAEIPSYKISLSE